MERKPTMGKQKETHRGFRMSTGGRPPRKQVNAGGVTAENNVPQDGKETQTFLKVREVRVRPTQLVNDVAY